MPLDNLKDGLLLPNRGILVPWGGAYEELKESASEARDWLPYGHDVRYGQLHWEDEILIPSLPTPSTKGKVIAYVKGDPLIVHLFELHIWDDGWLKRDISQYAAWMHQLSTLLGAPSVDTSSFTNSNIVAPTLSWQDGLVTIDSFYSLAKGDEYSGIRITHKNYNL